MIKIANPLLAALLWSLVSGVAIAAEGSAPAAAEPPPPPPALGTEYTEKGADTCLMCHTEAWPYPIFPIFKTKHAVRTDARTPFAGRQCEARRQKQRGK